jgi:hypothetical protein
LEGGVAWTQHKRLTGTEHGFRTFGRSLALDEDRLAVGAVGAHGASDGAVYLYDVDAWGLEQTVRPKTAQPGERFGSAVSLAGGVLVVGAPGNDEGAGAVYVFQRGPVRFREKAKLLPPDSPPLAGQQFGSAVATDRTQIFVGAPTADRTGDNSGAVYRFVRVGKDWKPEELPDVEVDAGAQLGYSLALSEDLLVAGAPAPPPGTGTGEVLVFRRSEGLWLKLLAGNAETHDLAGLAVAVDSNRVVVGGVLGDQGDGAAGAAWSFGCPGETCSEEAEAVARDRSSLFGLSVAVTTSFLAVGAEEERGETTTGMVYLYRRAGNGWRQQQRLTSPVPDDGFGASVALEGSLLAVGAPRAPFSPVSPPVGVPRGRVDLYAYDGSSWVFETSLTPGFDPGTEMAFGASIAISGGDVAVGAPVGNTAHLFHKESQSWTEIAVLTPGGEGQLSLSTGGFGSAVSMHGGVLGIGSPNEAGGGAVHTAVRSGDRWRLSQRLARRPNAAALEERFGSSVAVGDGMIAIGSPDFVDPGCGCLDRIGAVRVFQQSGTDWRETSQIRPSSVRRRFGASVALLGNRLAVGAPRQGEASSDDFDRAFIYELHNGEWEPVADLDALQPLGGVHGDEFGTAVALSEDFFVVTSPGRPPRGDRVTIFALAGSPGGDR